MKCSWCETTLEVDDGDGLVGEAFVLAAEADDESRVFCSGECLMASL